ncbi:hypothetical protein JG687_00001484 [Phytophthora cactorum]|uniref:FHA domain-containing protein n=1 Tax=Phytophthora cactorum TaxID=29920 RepID=A0A8T1V1R9_9STRA|nr:hypothetical protein PC120_g17800 [Phytophthora cactorum]KAG3066297.1 hypothetical protein PC121_g10909 [Phytophthora cactorum]KAG3165349.1 hypothetical protein PC128_g19932 [Phytophthora cactorum]KAG4046398.1 hypothetical protein PC123_g18230 [Phytophthora cactorum]KAG6972393.1 hypothetical protein JG687_00001484 [Phytophthora cactorum]
MERLGRRSRSRSPPRSSSGSRLRSRWQTRLRSRSRSRSKSPLQRTRREDRKERSPPRGRRNEDKKTRDFSHLIQWGKQEDEEKEEDPVEVEKPNFGLTGALAKDQTTGNMQNGVVMKFSEPPEARQPTKRYRLYVFKDDKNIATLHVHRKSAFLVGRDKAVADILTEHPSCSKQHAVLQYRMFQKETKDGLGFEQEVRPYIMDLNSTNATFLNGHKIEGSRYIELKEKDVLKFGESTREYVLLCAT